MRDRGTGCIEWRPLSGGGRIPYRIIYVDTSGTVHRETVAKRVGKPARKVTAADCHALLQRRLGEIHAGTFLGPTVHDRTMAELIHAKLAAYEVQRHGIAQQATLQNTRADYQRLARAFGMRRVLQVTAASIVFHKGSGQRFPDPFGGLRVHPSASVERVHSGEPSTQ